MPPPAINLLLYHGVLVPHARWRSQVVRYGRAPLLSPHAPVLIQAGALVRVLTFG